MTQTTHAPTSIYDGETLFLVEDTLSELQIARTTVNLLANRKKHPGKKLRQRRSRRGRRHARHGSQCHRVGVVGSMNIGKIGWKFSWQAYLMLQKLSTK
ncbi:hypothetical protein [Pseudoduganella sp. R-34]|uniref:hypothetical protein n=1 Tax=Pseudoduganella sp. R-34 TaxID=3404062 RepID=UPI003CF50BDB